LTWKLHQKTPTTNVSAIPTPLNGFASVEKRRSRKPFKRSRSLRHISENWKKREISIVENETAFEILHLAILGETFSPNLYLLDEGDMLRRRQRYRECLAMYGPVIETQGAVNLHTWRKSHSLRSSSGLGRVQVVSFLRW